jgi:hypothetical protein
MRKSSEMSEEKQRPIENVINEKTDEKIEKVYDFTLQETGKYAGFKTSPGARGGTLVAGINRTPGTGRPKSEVRERCVGSFDQRISIAEQILDNPLSNPADRLKALDLLGKYGGLQQIDNTSGDRPVTEPVDFGKMTVKEKKDYLIALTELP